MNRIQVPSNLLKLPDTLQMRATSICAYYGSRGRMDRSMIKYLKRRMSQVRVDAYSGTLTDGSKRRMKLALEQFSMLCRERRILSPVSQKMIWFRAAFITLTLPVDVSNDIENCLHTLLMKPFLQSLVRTYGVKKYVWRVERTKAGRLHWHIAIDEPIHYKHVQNLWNRQLRLNGFLKEYALEHGHFNAPSTEIRAVRSIKSAMAYLRKYMVKEASDEVGIDGRLWDAPLIVKRFKLPIIENALIEVNELLIEVWSQIDKVYKSDYFINVRLDLLPFGSETLRNWRKLVNEAVESYLNPELYARSNVVENVVSQVVKPLNLVQLRLSI